MSSHWDSSSPFRASTQFSSNNGSRGELPDDLETAREIIDSLTRQLKIHDDVTSNLLLLQKRIQHTHRRTQDAMRMMHSLPLKLEDRLDNIEATWTKELEDQHKRWLDKYNRLMREAENTRLLNKGTSKASAKHTNKTVKFSKQQLENLNRRAMIIDERINELENVASCTKNFDGKLHLDKQKIRDIDARLKTLTKKEQKLNDELTKQMNIHFGSKPFAQMTNEQSEKSFYGVCEVIDGYRKTIENLDKALRAMEQIKNLSVAKSKVNSTIQSTPSVDEIDEITVLMRRFLAKLRVQLASVHLYGKPALSPKLDTGKSGNLIETTTGFESSNPDTTSDFGPSTSSAHSQFMILKSEFGSEGTITAKGKSEKTSNNKTK
ncbi:Uncharacterized protein BM_BM502 [Brugia malayi]|uniref:Bm502 n=1 Tax=Brugia malayi TaxID=6279 RepID=A0A4E9FBG1_BRUMA|nr:Uncharacterized protein BM_BM502 [Brugia malayi]VIO94225.1 Uncharacterized protein BM_BM502 [Brugia malayi]